ncbi:MAG: hypothetical protein IKD03_06015 [Clostridia bacterium]|nr:hypothetical protein [Clostridia bacterium]
MKKILSVLFVVVVALFAFVACDTAPPASSGAENFTGIAFSDVTVDYDGQEHTIVAMNVPDFATMEYVNAGPFVNAGTYSVGVKINAPNYNEFTKTVTLKINKIDFSSDITFGDEKFFYNGEQKEITVTGTLPAGTTVTYANNKGVEAGEYEATATLTNVNYNTKTLNAKMTIVNVVDTAKNIMDKIMQRPDAWSFMPESFRMEEKAYSTDPSIDFSQNFVNVSNVKKNYIGKQMYVLWDGLVGFESFLSKLDLVYAAGETIANAYQQFINDNPENYTSWEGEVAGFKLKIELQNGTSRLLAGNSAFSIELYADSDNNVNKGRIQVAQNIIANYEMRDDYLKFTSAMEVSGVGILKQVEFVRNDDVVSGYFYEYTGAESVAVKTSAVIRFDEDYTVVMSAKRESDDLLVNGYEEVYSTQTGEMISAEVEESVLISDYDTHWVNVYDVSGINSVKAVKNDVDINPTKNQNDIYVNGSQDVFVPEYNTVAFVKTSRHYDIEMREVYYVVKKVEGDKTTYEVVKTEIPMVFVQEENIEDFASEVKENNSSAFASQPVLPSVNMTVAQNYFAGLKELLDAIKEQMSYAELHAQLGTLHPFFQ